MSSGGQKYAKVAQTQARAYGPTMIMQAPAVPSNSNRVLMGGFSRHIPQTRRSVALQATASSDLAPVFNQDTISFTKYQGIGNDFILIDGRHMTEPSITPEQAKLMCDRNFGVGADGVIFALKSDKADYEMFIYNSDGSVPEMCGNGLRCMANFVQSLEGKKGQKTTYDIWTGAGMIRPTCEENGQVRVDMGFAILDPKEIPCTLEATFDTPDTEQKAVKGLIDINGEPTEVVAISMGNPHCVTFVEDIEKVPLAEIGPLFESHEIFP